MSDPKPPFEGQNAGLPICFIDTETTALHHRRRAWEVAIIRREPGGRRRECSWFVHDVDLSEADPTSLKYARFHERHPCYGWSGHDDDGPNQDFSCAEEPYIANAVEELTRKAMWIGAVPDFDTFVLDDMLRRHGLAPQRRYHLIDVENLAVGWLAAGNQFAHRYGPDDAPAKDAQSVLTEITRQLITPPWRSDDLTRACGVEPPSDEDRHTALGDARWVERWYDRITGVA